MPLIKANVKVYEHCWRTRMLWRWCTWQIPRVHVVSVLKTNLKKNLKSMFKPLGTSVPSWKMSRRSSRCRVTVPPFTCLTTDTHMSWTWLCSGRLKCSATGNPPPGSGGSVWNPPLNAGVPRNDPKAFDRFRQCTACNSAGTWWHRLHQPQYSRTVPLAEHLRWRWWPLPSFPWSHMCGTGVYGKENSWLQVVLSCLVFKTLNWIYLQWLSLPF